MAQNAQQTNHNVDVVVVLANRPLEEEGIKPSVWARAHDNIPNIVRVNIRNGDNVVEGLAAPDTNEVGHNDAQEGQESNVVERFAAPKFISVGKLLLIVFVLINLYFIYIILRAVVKLESDMSEMRLWANNFLM